jgi:hypothetical protein
MFSGLGEAGRFIGVAKRFVAAKVFEDHSHGVGATTAAPDDTEQDCDRAPDPRSFHSGEPKAIDSAPFRAWSDWAMRKSLSSTWGFLRENL